MRTCAAGNTAGAAKVAASIKAEILKSMTQGCAHLVSGAVQIPDTERAACQDLTPEGVFSSVQVDQLVAVLTEIRERAAA